MNYHQKCGLLLKSELSLDMQETGFKYIFTDKNLIGPSRTEEVFIPYTYITNQKTYAKRNHPSGKKVILPLAILILIIFVALVVSSTHITYGSVYETYLNIAFYVILASIFLIYKTLAVQKVVIIKEGNGLSFTLFKDTQTEEIIKDILKRRNTYLRGKYFDGDNYKTLSLESVEYLSSLEVINKDEAAQIKEKIRRNAGGVGFKVEA